MSYRVRITESALADAREYVEFIRTAHREIIPADRWFRGVLEAIFSLEDSPRRAPAIPESGDFPLELRHLIYHSHRIIFHIDEHAEAVLVIRIYHGARRALRPEDLD